MKKLLATALVLTLASCAPSGPAYAQDSKPAIEKKSFERFCRSFLTARELVKAGVDKGMVSSKRVYTEGDFTYEVVEYVDGSWMMLMHLQDGETTCVLGSGLAFSSVEPGGKDL